MQHFQGLGLQPLPQPHAQRRGRRCRRGWSLGGRSVLQPALGSRCSGAASLPSTAVTAHWADLSIGSNWSPRAQSRLSLSGHEGVSKRRWRFGINRAVGTSCSRCSSRPAGPAFSAEKTQVHPGTLATCCSLDELEHRTRWGKALRCHPARSSLSHVPRPAPGGRWGRNPSSPGLSLPLTGNQ